MTATWIGIVAVILAAAALAGTLYALVFVAIGIALRSRRAGTETPCPAGPQPTNFLVIIPAHNEGTGVAPTIASVLGQKYPAANLRCVVVADNCTDDTAEVAAQAGAQVLIRSDAERRGKGHALDWAFQLTRELSWDAVCVIDADSVAAPDFLQVLDASLRQGHAVIQGRYNFAFSPDNGNWLEMFTCISRGAENTFTYPARQHLGLMQLLIGNGFCVTRSVIERVPWKAHSIVEDAEYSVALGQQGIPVHYEDRARICSRQATTVRDTQPQRVRWASGTLQLFRTGIPALLRTAVRRRSWRAVEGAFMLLLTSRLFLIYLLGMSLLLSLATTPSWGWMARGLVVCVAGLQLLYLILMFRFASDEPVALIGVLRLPYYVAVIASAQLLAMIGFNRRVWWRTAR